MRVQPEGRERQSGGCHRCPNCQQRRWRSYCNGEDSRFRRRSAGGHGRHKRRGSAASLRSTTASADATFQDFITDEQDILAGFSGQGPSKVDFAIKPDVTSVGVNVLSSITCVGKGPAAPGTVQVGPSSRNLNVNAAHCRIGCGALGVASRLVTCPD